MAKSKTATFRFTTRLSSMKGNFISTVIYLPDEIIESLPKGRVRTKGTINGAPFALAPQYKKDGSRFFSVSASLRRQAKIREGDKVEVIFKLVNPDLVDIPEELEAVLAQDDEGKKVWDEFTRGMQRSIIHYISSVKNVDGRIKRALETIEKAKLGQLSVQKVENRKRKAES